MGKYITCFNFNEVQLDDNLQVIKEFEKNLPHHDIIGKKMCKSWNDLHIEQFFDGILAGKISSARMSYRKDKGKSLGVLTFETRKGIHFTPTMKSEVDEQVSAQFTDGWGEGFFGYINIMKDPIDGTMFMVE